jgi:hypothetical protein
MSRRITARNAFETGLDGAIGDTDQTISLDSAVGLVAPGILVIDPLSPTLREVIQYDTVNVNDLEDVTRGLTGSAAGAQGHTTGARIRSVFAHQYLDDIFDDIEDLETDIGDLETFDAAHDGAGAGAHADVIAAGADGFMTGADKTKLDGIDTEAKDDQVLVGGADIDVSGSPDYTIDLNIVDMRAVGVFAGHDHVNGQAALTDSFTTKASVALAMPSGWTTALVLAWGTSLYTNATAGVQGQAKISIDGVGSGGYLGAIPGTNGSVMLTAAHLSTSSQATIDIVLEDKKGAGAFSTTGKYAWINALLIRAS